MGPIITLSNNSLNIKDRDTFYTYKWSTIKNFTVEVVTERNINSKYVSHTVLTLWTTAKDSSDEFQISDLEMDSDEIRKLINEYVKGTAANTVLMQ